MNFLLLIVYNVVTSAYSLIYH